MGHGVQEEERKLQQELDAAQRRVHEALCDNINTQARPSGCVHAASARSYASPGQAALAARFCMLNRPPGAPRQRPSAPPPPSPPPPTLHPISPGMQAAMLALTDLVKAANVYLSKRQDTAGGCPCRPAQRAHHTRLRGLLHGAAELCPE